MHNIKESVFVFLERRIRTPKLASATNNVTFMYKNYNPICRIPKSPVTMENDKQTS